MAILLACSAELIGVFHLNWLPSITAGLVSGLVLSVLGGKYLRRRWPGRPSFRAYVLWDPPEVLQSVLTLVESVAEVETWSIQNNSQLEIVRSEISLDDALVNSALELVDYLRSTLQGLPFRKVEGLPENLAADGIRRELRLISADLRLAIGK